MTLTRRNPSLWLERREARRQRRYMAETDNTLDVLEHVISLILIETGMAVRQDEPDKTEPHLRLAVDNDSPGRTE